MNGIQFVSVIVTFINFVIAADPPGGYYQTKYDSLDVEEILNNKRLVNHYVNCLLNRGACPPQGADLRRILPEALATNCLRCTEKQKEVVIKTVRRLRTEYPILWSELVSEYDPEGEYFVKFVLTLDPSTEVDDQANLLSNRFGDDNFPYDLLPTTPKPTSPTTTTKKPKRTFTTPFVTKPSTTRTVTTPSTTRTTTTRTTTTMRTISTSRTAEPAMTRTEEDELLLNIFTTLPPLTSMFSRNTIRQADPKSTPPPVKASSVIADPSPVYGWRPTVYGELPQANRPPHPFTQGGVNLLSSLGQIGTKVIQAGTQVAGMVLNAFVGKQ